MKLRFLVTIMMVLILLLFSPACVTEDGGRVEVGKWVEAEVISVDYQTPTFERGYWVVTTDMGSLKVYSASTIYSQGKKYWFWATSTSLSESAR